MYLSKSNVRMFKTEDKRKKDKGIVCTTMDSEKLQMFADILKLTDKSKKKSMCYRIEKKLLELQLKTEDIRYIYTIFESSS